MVSNEVCSVGVWAYAYLHVCRVSECEDVNVACGVIIISSFLATHVQILSWPAGVTVSQKDIVRVTKDRKTSD